MKAMCAYVWLVIGIIVLMMMIGHIPIEYTIDNVTHTFQFGVPK